IWGTNASKNAQALEALAHTGRRLLAFQCDVAHEAQVEEVFAKSVAEMGKVDACFANAGVGGGGKKSFVEMTSEEWRRVMSVNLDGAFYTFRAAARHMVERGQGGRLIGTASLAAIEGAARNEHYGATKGGNSITFNFITYAELNPAEFRAFFFPQNSPTALATYHHNVQATLVSTNASVRFPGETEFHYTTTISSKVPENRPLQIGDKMELEISQFILAPRNGRNNYYGTTFLYIVGRGIVPWYAKEWEDASSPVAGITSFDSSILPEDTWLGGQTALPYQYSNEPENRFKQMAGNITPENGQPFMLGRRIHHTDFLTGAHSEAGNPVFTNHVGKLGPKFVAQSCVACHINNGRSLLPSPGSSLTMAVVKVGTSAAGDPHPVLGEQLHPRSTTGTPEAGVTLSGFTYTNGTYGDGTPYSLRKPQYQFSGVTPSFYSVRLAPALVGMGLLEAIPESSILALADPLDANGDGISGRAHYVPDPTNPSAIRLG
ncbi:MAG: SDR family NAD(P)-dependent oxidoreductase, partial [Verrucomicrobia bacterium]|nr:SDR family NAD(P)-dependent oxidoreductase [Verrucomicrobiota bacterium]